MSIIPVSVCIIAKNEEKNIEKCLRAIHKHPFEIIVVDTGSTDMTKELAARYADKVLDFEWIDDFSAARNFSIDAASNDWILVLDCDEFVEKLNFQEMQKLMKQYPHAIGQLTRDNLCYGKNHEQVHSTDLVERLFNRKLYHYEGTIHEQVVRRDGTPAYGFAFPLYITHIGYFGTEEEILAKSERNISMLKAALEQDPEDPYLYYQLGESYMLRSDYENAYEYYDKGFYLDVDETLEYVQRMIISYGYSMIYTNRIEKALYLANVRDSFADIADFLFMLGNVYLKATINDKALAEFINATKLTKHFDEGTNSFRAYHNIGCIYEAYGHYDEARKYYEKAGDFPMSVERLNNLPK